MDDFTKPCSEHEKHLNFRDASERPRSGLLSGVQYLYFMRFSLLYLLAIPLLAYEDWGSGLSSITRGIFTPSDSYSFLGDAFFLTCVGVIGLVTARLVVTNGKDRFGVEPPSWLAKRLGGDSDLYAGRMLIYFQLPGIAVLGYLHFTAHKEQVSGVWSTNLLISALGIAIAIVFWGSLNIIYYWTAGEDTGGHPGPSCFLDVG
jgi:hypothetical protein